MRDHPLPKLIVQVPAYNEAATLGQLLAEIPRTLRGVSRVEVLVIDDGSTDETAQIARAAGADYLVRNPANLGLARTFQAGMDACLAAGADIIVNIDADNQYPAAEIPRLIAPIVAGAAQIVVGDRQVHTLAHFSPLKRWLEQLGSWTVAVLTGLNLPDAPSGFRAYSREAALRLHVSTNFSYTLDNLIQAGQHRLAVTSVPITARHTPRPSRLHKGALNFIARQAATLLYLFTTYRPWATYAILAAPFLLTAVILLGRLAIIFLLTGFDLPGHLQSLVLGGVMLLVGFQILLFGLIANRIAANRYLMEEILYRLRRQGHEPIRSGAAAPGSGSRKRPRRPASTRSRRNR